ncbi:hypothetical protein GGD83_003934 [Rhodoblastus sphagnicola]|nr:M15 family metallopeptidase [Rhodoblastus sphagnicola]MBB4200107.1 hypothetical protein [Rhodoblastus sphagnicola]
MACVLTGDIGCAAGPLPKGFAYLRDVDPSIRQDIRYSGSHNFIGRPVDGYRAAERVLAEAAASALKKAQESLAQRQLSLIVWDCYRPAPAMRGARPHFVSVLAISNRGAGPTGGHRLTDAKRPVSLRYRPAIFDFTCLTY